METPDARRALLAGLVDHAPMFPPASLSADEALVEDARAAESKNAFMLARLVWPASAVGSLRGSRPVSLVLDVDPTGELAVQAVEAVEAQYRGDLDSLRLAGEVYVEVPLDDALGERLDALAAHGLRAKVRCGGAIAPPSAELARFVSACRDRELVFKATAGLHNAVRTNGEHGFLNLLAAAAFPGQEEAALDETDPGAFSVTAGAFSWCDHSASASELGWIRRELIHSIGSCSFFEPVEELEALGVLPL